MRRAVDQLRALALATAVLIVIIDICARDLLHAASTNFHSNGRNYEQHRPTSKPRGT